MPFEYDYLTRYRFNDVQQAYTARDTMLYALGLGLGSDPLDPGQLRFCYESELESVPTMAVALGHPGFWAGNKDLGIDWVRMLHVGQGLTLYDSVPTAGVVITRARIADVVDRGAEKGALIFYERDLVDADSNHLIATVRQTLLCRGNGGFGGPEREIEAPPAIPEREPDHVVLNETLPQQALIYRLSGDLNPLHADPAVAAKAGFPRPILHGLATYGVAATAILGRVLDFDARRLKSFDVRFTSPVYPGDALQTEIWVDGNEALTRTTVPARGVVALNNGHALLA